jgi:hypothetical protein
MSYLGKAGDNYMGEAGQPITADDVGTVVEPADATILKDADIGVNVQAYNSGISSTPIIQGSHTIGVPAAAMQATETNGAAAASQEMATNDVMVNGFDFDAATNEHVQIAIPMPKGWNEGTIQVAFRWKDADTAGTGNVVWGCKALAVGDNDAIDSAWGTGQEVTDSFITSGDLHKSAYTAAITAAGTPAAEDDLILDVYRNAASGSDTYTQDARLIGIRVLYTVNAGDDS